MATARVLYFSGTTPVKTIHQVSNARFARAFPGIRGKRADGFTMWIAHPVDGPDASLPVTRMIDYKANPSLHKCDARCQNAKGRTCECSCGGQYHGAGAAQ